MNLNYVNTYFAYDSIVVNAEIFREKMKVKNAALIFIKMMKQINFYDDFIDGLVFYLVYCSTIKVR